MKTTYFKNHYKFYILTLFLFIFIDLPTAVAEKKITINTGTLKPLFSADGKGFYNKLIKEAFSRLDINADVIHLTSARAMRNVNQGLDDGTMLRIKGLDKKLKNIIRVPIPILRFKFVAYSLNKNIQVTDWDSLKPYSVGIVRGWKIYEKNVVGTKKLTLATGVEQLFKLLINKRSDIVLFEQNRGGWWNKYLNANAYLIGKPLAEKDMFIYLHKKHKALVPKLAKVLSEMKKDGSYQRIKNNTLSLH